jgi:hypothetical protein
MGRLNKPAKEGYSYRSPNQTNAQDLTPNLMEDVIASQNADSDRIVRSNNDDRKGIDIMNGLGYIFAYSKCLPMKVGNTMFINCR